MREQEVLDETWLRDAVSSMMEEQLQVPLYMVDPDDGSIIWSNRAFATLYAQGFHLGRPMPGAAVPAWLSKYSGAVPAAAR